MIGTGSAPTVASGSTAPAIALQTVETEGGSALVVGLVLASLALSLVLSVAIAYRLLVGYRGSGDRSMLAVAVGLVLLTTVPTAIRITVPTLLGGPATVRIVAATASEVAGSLTILYAVRTPVRTRQRVDRSYGATILPLAVLGGLAGAVAVDSTVLADNLGTVAQSVTAVVGGYVARLAYRGYRRNDSAPMAFLALALVLLTVVQFLAATVLSSVAGVSDAQVLLAMSLGQLGGLLAMYYSLTRA